MDIERITRTLAASGITSEAADLLLELQRLRRIEVAAWRVVSALEPEAIHALIQKLREALEETP